MPFTKLLSPTCLIAVLAAAMALTAAPACAQDEAVEAAGAQADSRPAEVQPDPQAIAARELLEAASKALSEAGAFSADIELAADIEQAFARDLMPTASGTMVASASPDGDWRVRIEGTTRPMGQSEDSNFDVLWADRKVTTVEHLNQTVVEGPVALVKGTLLSTVGRLQAIPGLTEGSAPFETMLNNPRTTFALGDTIEVDGIECRVVRATMVIAGRPQYHSIAIGVDDQLPYRIMRHNVGFESGPAIGTEFSQFVLGDDAIAGRAWTIETPTGYEREIITTPQARSPAQSGQLTGNDGASKGVTKSPSLTPSYPLSPKWQFQTRDGEVVSHTSIKGKTSVLYFWGTWCIPCKRAAPLNEQLWEDFGGQKHFEMVGLAVRERDPDATYQAIDDAGYGWTQLVGADKVATLFEVERYPTWFVIGPAGEVLYQSGRPEGGDFEPIFAEMRKAIDKGLELSK